MNSLFICELDGWRQRNFFDVARAAPAIELGHRAQTAYPVFAVPSATPRSVVSKKSAVNELERYVIPNLRNSCRILKLLGQHPDGLKAAELARRLDIPVTTTLRIMATLLLEGFARKHEGRYELGPVLIQLGNAALAGTEIRDLALPLLHKLTMAVDETSHLAIPCDQRALIVAVEDSPHPLGAASRPGFLAELHCSSTGKIFLSHLYREQLAEIVVASRATRRTDHTLVTLSQLKREVELTLKRGYSLDNEEFNLGVRCLAAPVFDADGVVIAAIGITAATVRFTKERISEIATKVRAVAGELSALMGYSERR
jgi:IclR family acetate operon transcriptional repressor